MKASEAITHLQHLVEEYGDRDLRIDDGMELAPIEDINVPAEEDDHYIVIWMEV